uniref:Putative secreted peptide n=1 Tax=Anopheles braziliensis TaxID=58242 RepID=A0A2M3ZP63_9DIPT
MLALQSTTLRIPPASTVALVVNAFFFVSTLATATAVAAAVTAATPEASAETPSATVEAPPSSGAFGFADCGTGTDTTLISNDCNHSKHFSSLPKANVWHSDSTGILGR